MDWPGDQSLLVTSTTIKAQLQKDRAHRPHNRASGALSLIDEEAALQGPTGHLLYKAMLPNPGDITIPPNT